MEQEQAETLLKQVSAGLNWCVRGQPTFDNGQWRISFRNEECDLQTCVSDREINSRDGAADVEEQIAEHVPVEKAESEQENWKQERTDPELLTEKRLQAVDAFARWKGIELERHSRTLFWSSDKSLRVCCAVSKRYEGEYQPYWYAYHPNWDRFLDEGNPRRPKSYNGSVDSGTHSFRAQRLALPVPISEHTEELVQVSRAIW